MERMMNRKIRVKPEHLGPNLVSNIRTQLESEVVNQCTEDTGYILKIIEIVKVIDNFVENSSSDIVVEILFSFIAFKPLVGDVIDTTVCAVYKDGILVNAHDCQKILVPSSTYIDHIDVKGNVVWNGEEVVQGSLLKVRVTAVRYNDHKFSCIGVIA